MTSIAGHETTAKGIAAARAAGQAIAYSIVPLSVVQWSSLPAISIVFVPIYLVAAIGLVAAAGGLRMPATIVTVGYFLLACYVVLLGVEIVNGDFGRYPRPVDSNFLTVYFILPAFPFFALGLQAVGARIERFEMAMGATIVISAGWSLYQFVTTGSPRVGGFNDLNQLPYAMAILLWSLFLLARAFASQRFDAVRAAVAFAGLVPIFFSGSKLVWLVTGLGYAAILLWWAWSWRQWIVLGAFAFVAGGGAFALYQTRFVRRRITPLVAELTAFASTGDTSGPTFGLRLSAAVSGFLAFLERPFFGYGLADVKLAALAHRPDYVTEFTHLWHLHNQYITHMVAFGIFGLLFLVGLLALFPFAGLRSGDEGVKRFGFVAPALIALYMLAAIYFSQSALYGITFVLLGLVLLAGVETSASRARPG